MRGRIIDAVISVVPQSLSVVDSCQVDGDANKSATVGEGNKDAVELLLADDGGV